MMKLRSQLYQMIFYLQNELTDFQLRDIGYL